MIKLDNLLKGIKYKLIKGSMDTIVSDMAYDSREVKKDMAFIAIIGANQDGHDYLDSAIKNGAVAVIVSKDIDIKEDITVIKVKDTRKELAKLALNLFNHPQNRLKTIAITGTKGKTTTSFMIKKIL